MLLARDGEEFVVSTFYHWAKTDKNRSLLVDCMVPILHRVRSVNIYIIVVSRVAGRLFFGNLGCDCVFNFCVFRPRQKHRGNRRGKQIEVASSPSDQRLVKYLLSWTDCDYTESPAHLVSSNAIQVIY